MKTVDVSTFKPGVWTGVVVDQIPWFREWAEHRIGVRFFDDAKTIAWVTEGLLRAVTVFDRFSTIDVCMHVASDGEPNWLHRKFLAASFGYPFIDLRKRRVTAMIAGSNPASLRFCRHLGFVPEGICRQAADDGSDLCILGLLRIDCHYIPREARDG